MLQPKLKSWRMMFKIVFLGTAGCGKTSLTYAFGEWLKEELDASISYINMDPGVYTTPYKPSYDVREIVTVEKLMEEGLGPNGGMIRAAEIIEENLGVICNEINSLSSDFILIDTPGQLELFLFRSMGPRLIEDVSRYSPTVSVYIMDPAIASSSSGLAISLTLPLITRLRLKVPTVSVINKSDMPEIYKVEKFLEDVLTLGQEIAREESGLIGDLASRYIQLLKEFSKSIRIVKTSAKTGEGMSDLYTIVHEALCECGDLM